MTDVETRVNRSGKVRVSGIVGFTKVTISMPLAMHAELRGRARRRGISVTELMRRAVALDALVFDTGAQQEVVLRDKATEVERVLQLL